MAGMRWQTAVDVVSSGVEAHIEDLNNQAGKGRELMYLLRQIPAPGKSNTRVPGISESVKPTGRVQPGSIPERVLEIVGEFDEPVARQQILDAKHGAKTCNVVAAIRQLVKSGHLIATGNTSTRRYSLPVKRKGAK